MKRIVIGFSFNPMIYLFMILHEGKRESIQSVWSYFKLVGYVLYTEKPCFYSFDIHGLVMTEA